MDKENPIKKDLEKIPLVYIYICKKISENFKINQIIPYRNLIYHITKMTYHMPRKYYDLIIKELIDFKLINKVSGGRSPSYELSKKDYESLIKDLHKIENSTQRFKILKKKYDDLLKLIEKEEKFEQKYQLLRLDFEKLLRKLELKKLEGSHYW